MLRGIATDGKGLGGVQDLASKIVAERELKLDLVASTGDQEMLIDEDDVPSLAIKDHGAFPLLKLAHDQLGSRLGIPAKYYDRMMADDPHLLAANVNAWLWNNPTDRRLVRTLGGDARAYLSNRYQRIDHHEVAEVAFPILAEVPDLNVVSCEITPTRMYVQVVSPRVQGEVKKGDVVQAGVIISNSEVGCGAVSVASVIWRLRCLNGMVGQDKFRAFHVGRQIDDNEGLWADDTRRADDKTILLKVRDMVRAALSEERFQGYLAQMQGLAAIDLTGNAPAVVEVLSDRIGASEAERNGILNALIKGGDLSAWGVINAVTAQAHDARDYDRAIEIETAGGQLLALSQGEWRNTLAAA